MNLGSVFPICSIWEKGFKFKGDANMGKGETDTIVQTACEGPERPEGSRRTCSAPRLGSSGHT